VKGKLARTAAKCQKRSRGSRMRASPGVFRFEPVESG